MPHIFISYAREDVAMARGLADVLESEGFEVWWDDHIRVGEEFPEKIERAIWDCHHVIVLWSKDSVGSEWVHQEALLAKGLKKLLPVKLGECELPLGYKTLHTIEFGNWGTLLEALYNVIGGGGFSLPSYARHAPPMSIPMPSAPPASIEPPPGLDREPVWRPDLSPLKLAPLKKTRLVFWVALAVAFLVVVAAGIQLSFF